VVGGGARRGTALRFFDAPLNPPLNRSADDHSLLWVNATKQCRRLWIAKGVDRSAYNTTESSADLEDLRQALGTRVGGIQHWLG
jgi:hypothetical protein